MRTKDPILLALFEPYVRCNLEALADAARGAVERPDEPEHLHDLRVACRRLRQALRLLGPALARKRLKKWREGIADLSRTVGPARDLDVQRIMLKELLAPPQDDSGGGALQAAVQAVDHALAQHRARLQKEVVATITTAGAMLAGLVRQWQRALPQLAQAQLLWKAQRRALKKVTDQEAAPAPWPARLREYAGESITQVCRQIVAMGPAALPLDAVAPRHELRSRVRRLRYSLEMFAPLYRHGFKAQIRQLKRLQDALGELHDLDVWVTDLLPAWRKRLGKDDLVALGGRLQERRRKLHARMLRLWRQLLDVGFWEQWSDDV